MQINNSRIRSVVKKTRQTLMGRVLGLLLVLLITEHGMGQETSVRLIPIDGAPVEGKLISADSQDVRLEIAEERKSWSSQDILKLELAPKSTAAAAPLELRLQDGSQLKGSKLTGREQQWQFEDSFGEVRQLGPGTVRSLLVRNVTPEQSAAWKDALKEPGESDALILIRPGNVVDRVNGIIVEVMDEKVGFDLDGQTVEVGFEKLLGMIWFRKQTERLKPKIEIEFSDGSKILTDTLTVAGDSATYRSIDNQEITLPTSRISLLNYANANVRWLAEVPALNAVANGRIEWKPDLKNVSRALAPQFVANRGSGSQSEAQGAETLDLVFVAPGSLTFRVPDGFTRFRTTIERTGQGAARSDVLIEVWQDDQNLTRHAFGANEGTLELEVPVLAGKKVILSVVSNTRLQVGSQMTWKQPRLTR